MKALLFNRWGDFLHALNLYTCNQFCEINGEDYIDIETDEPLAKGDRIVIYDGNKQWLEYVFNEGEQKHVGEQTYKMTCENSLMWDLSLKHIRYAGWDSANAQYAMTELLKLHPLWSVGTVLSTSSKKLVYERESAYQALLETCGAFNCEIKKTVTMGKEGVLKREVSLLEHIGTTKPIRFDYKDGLFGVTKTINADPVLTAVYGYGSGIDDNELWCYVTNDENTKLWGLPDGKGAIHHAEGEFTDNDIEDKATLTQAATDYLNSHCAPSITYETDIPFAAIEGAMLGDTIQVVDTEFYPELRLDTRIGAMERDLISNVVSKAVFGNVISYLPDALARSFDQEKVIIKQTAVIGELRSDLKSTQESLRSAQSSLSTASKNIGDLQRDLQQAQRDLETANDALEYAKKDAATAQQDAAAAKKQANDLSATVQSQGKTIEELRETVKNELKNEQRLHMTFANSYTASWSVGDIWLKARRGGTVTSDDMRIADYYMSIYYQNYPHRNESLEQMYNEIALAYNSQDQGAEGPTIGDEQAGTGPQIALGPPITTVPDDPTDTAESDTPMEEE